MTPKFSASSVVVVTIWQFVIVVWQTAVIFLLGQTASPALHIGSGMHVFLQTAQVNVSIPGKELSHSLTVRAIFDTGAQRSYISQKVVNALKLKTVRTERLKIATFGDQNQELEAVNLVEHSLTKSGQDLELASKKVIPA